MGHDEPPGTTQRQAPDAQVAERLLVARLVLDDVEAPGVDLVCQSDLAISDRSVAEANEQHTLPIPVGRQGDDAMQPCFPEKASSPRQSHVA